MTETVLEKENSQFTVETASSAKKGLELVREDRPDCIVSDYDMLERNGVEFLRAVREDHAELPFILFTGKGSESVASEAIASDVTDYLQKGGGTEQYELLSNRIENAVQARLDAGRAARHEELMRLTEYAGDTGGWELDVENEDLMLTDGTRRLIGAPEDTELSLEDAIELYHPADREAVTQAIDRVSETGEERRGSWRLQTLDGEERQLEVILTPVTANGDVTAVRGAINDVTERRERQRELEDERQFTEQALNSLEELFYVAGPEGSLQRWNDRVPEITGYAASELADMEPIELLPEGEREDAAESIKTLRSGSDATLEADLLTAADQRIPYEFTGGLLTDADGNTTGFVGVGRDISDRRQRERRFEALVEESSDIISIIDTDGRFEYQSPSVERILGYDPEETIGDTIWEYVHPDDSEAAMDAFAKWVDSPAPTQSVEYRVRHADGSWRWMEVRGNKQTDNPSVDGYVVNSRDITERKQREEQLQRANRAIEAAPVGITITDPSQPDNPMIDVNDEFLSITGYSREDVVGSNCRLLQGEQTSEASIKTLRTGIENQEPVSTEIRNYRKDGTAFWNRLDIAPVRDETGEVVNHVGFQQDITDQKQDKQQLEKREQTLRELHAATRDFYPPSDRTEIAEFLVGFLSGAFEFPYVSVKQFDEEENCLQPAAPSSTSLGETDTLYPVEPGPNPIWRAYEHGEPRTFDMQQHDVILDGSDPSVDRGLAFPVGDFGVIVVCVRDDDPIDDVARDLLDVVAANAESAFERLDAAETNAAVAAELSTQQARVDELTTITDTHQQLHEDLAAGETRESLDASVCDHLTQTERIDFVWIGRPEGVETNLQPTVWAGQESGYLDEVGLTGGEDSFPAQCVVSDHEQCSISDIGSHATEADWAKHALTAGFRSVISVPLVHDDVLYGVLSAYSTDESAFDQTYRNLITNAGSLLVSYNRTLANRYEGTQQEFTILEFELSDPAYPFNQLAATTDCRIRVDTVIETTDTAMRLLVTVLDGDPETVLDRAPSVTTITDADWFGDDSNQLSVTVQKPFLASVLGKHDAVLCEAVSGGDGTSFRVELHGDTSKRPVLDALLSEYQEISPVAQRQGTNTDTLGTIQTEEILTDRQREVLSAAFHGGYYETPKGVTGNDIAAAFDISSTAVHNHLTAANRQILEAVVDGGDGYQL